MTDKKKPILKIARSTDATHEGANLWPDGKGFPRSFQTNKKQTIQSVTVELDPDGVPLVTVTQKETK